jgi:MoaA/NifB/PqqE/SkfB family radical SAM enzyme
MYSLFGGEPFLHPRLEEIIRTIKEAGSVVDTPTNGTLLKEKSDMLIRTKFDNVRVSIDGPREINDSQRGAGSYDKAMYGIETLYRKKQEVGAKRPLIGIIYTVTPENHLSIEQFFLHDLNLSAVDWITIQTQNFLTEEMGEDYARMLKSEFGISSDAYWKGFIRSTEDFSDIDTVELARQVNVVCERLGKIGKNILLLPPTFSSENLKAYFDAKWDKMTDRYVSCPSPWTSIDVTATGGIATCHMFYDLVMGSLYEQDFEEIWNGVNYRKFRDYMEQHQFMSICPGCCILYLAGKNLRKWKKRNKIRD